MFQLGFERVAIVNRGEPALRLIRAVNELRAETGRPLRTIALYTEVDRSSLFVRAADEAVALGPATRHDTASGRPTSPYLDYAVLRRALLEARADAAWVGWGFVAERPGFADLCEALGITFIGPSASVMRQLGDKMTAKRLAEEAGVPVAPWSGGPVASLEEARGHLERLGLPLLIKAAAGGGGRGIRKVERPADLESALARSRAEAAAAFGSDAVFMESLVSRARHVEVQILGDDGGTVWDVGVRDCTLQRRHQKVMEEAPCVSLAAADERAVREAAVRLAKAAGYRNAGTVEFLVDAESGRFYFMEVNTRLQVEHPVTEATTGLDLVKLQLHLASGGRLEGEPPPTFGHAVEARLCAEDPERDFAPSPGRLALFRMAMGPGIRLDVGLAEGDAIPAEFDSMVAKVIAWGRTRAEALARLRVVLRQSAVVIENGATNKGFLLELASHPEVRESRLHTRWIDDYVAQHRDAYRPHAEIALYRAAIDVYDSELAQQQAVFVRSAARGRPLARAEYGLEVELQYRGHTYACVVRAVGPGDYCVRVGGSEVSVHVEGRGPGVRWLAWLGERYHTVAHEDGHGLVVEVEGIVHTVEREAGGLIRSPAPALVLSVEAEEGSVVARGDTLCLLEAMKTEMRLTAPAAGRVRRVLVRPNERVSQGSPIVMLEPESDAPAEQEAPRLRFGLGVAAPGDSSASGTEAARVMALLERLRRLFLGYDLEPDEVHRLCADLHELRGTIRPEDPAVHALERELLTCYADAILLHEGPELEEGSRLAPRDCFVDWVRSPDSAGRRMPEPYRKRLERALGRYGVAELPRYDVPQDALYRLYLAYVRSSQMIEPLALVLERYEGSARELRTHVDDGLREVLEEVQHAAAQRAPRLADAAGQARFRLFDEPAIEQARAAVYAELDGLVDELVRAPVRADRDTLVAKVVASPHPIVGFLARRVAAGDAAVRRVVLELQVRRFYASAGLSQLAFAERYGLAFVSGRLREEGAADRVVAALAMHDQLDLALRGLAELTAEGGALEGVVWECFVCTPGTIDDPETWRGRVADALATVAAEPRVARACFGLVSSLRSRADHYLTFEPRPSQWREVDQYRGLHPMWAERLELWRLSDFALERLPGADDVYLYRAVAHGNPRDVRLFALVDVRVLAPTHDAAGVLELPHLERMMSLTLAAMRDHLYKLPPHERPNWNRLLLYVWPTLTLAAREIAGVLSRVVLESPDVGLEKVVLRARVPEAETGALTVRALRFSVSEGRLGRFRTGAVSDAPIRTLSPYQQKVAKLRARGLTYPYEIVRYLTPESKADEVHVPEGWFEEYDLDEAGRLVPVERNYGENTAAVVVGLVANRTSRYPEGMLRVLLLSDPSKGMGALAEPECRRIVEAIDLAQARGLPVDWFAVSAGARISMTSGTENLDWTARVLRRLVEFTQEGGFVNVVVAGVNVGAQSYWNAEATMLMHTRGVLIMVRGTAMVLTGHRALEYSGSVSAESDAEVGGLEVVMGPNGQAQYAADDVHEACVLLLHHHEHTWVAPGEHGPRRAETSDPADRDVLGFAHVGDGQGANFTTVGEIFSAEANGARKRSFDIRSVMRAVIDQDHAPLERWAPMRDAETAVVWEAHLGGWPVCLIGIESRPLARVGGAPGDGPETWSGGTLFPLSSKKIARALNAASGNRPVVVLANLSGFDGSPESMRKLQLEHGAEIGRAVVNFRGPLVFCVVSRYHGGAYVVFSRALNENLQVLAVEGAYASVIGGAPAASVVLRRDVDQRTYADPRVREAQAALTAADAGERAEREQALAEVLADVRAEQVAVVAEAFESVHTVERARQVGSVDAIVPARELRRRLVESVAAALPSAGANGDTSAPHLAMREPAV